MVLLGIVAGVLVILLGIKIAKWLDSHANNAEMASRDSNSPVALDFSVTGVSGDLVPLVSGIEHEPGKARIDLFGDGSYVQLDGKGNDWINGMKHWIDNGWNVTYTVLFPSETTKDLLLKLMEDAREGALVVYIIDDEGDTSQFKDLVDKRRTFHPNLIHDGFGGNGMWVEGTHMAGSEYAYNVEYVSPKAMTAERQQQFKQYDAENISLRKCGRKLSSDAGTT